MSQDDHDLTHWMLLLRLRRPQTAQSRIAALECENERLRQWVQHLRSDACDDGSHYSGSLKLCDIYLCCDLALSGNPAPQTTATPHITTYQALLDCQQQLAAVTKELTAHKEKAAARRENCIAYYDEQLAALRAENERLRQENARIISVAQPYEQNIADLTDQLAALRAENERLNERVKQDQGLVGKLNDLTAQLATMTHLVGVIHMDGGPPHAT